jgi:hypothetical protein
VAPSSIINSTPNEQTIIVEYINISVNGSLKLVLASFRLEAIITLRVHAVCMSVGLSGSAGHLLLLLLLLMSPRSLRYDLLHLGCWSRLQLSSLSYVVCLAGPCVFVQHENHHLLLLPQEMRLATSARRRRRRHRTSVAKYFSL